MKRKEKVYYPQASQAPYFSRDEAEARAASALQGNYTTVSTSASSYALLPLRRVTSVQSTLARTTEADAAAGGSLLLLPRVASTPHVAGAQGSHKQQHERNVPSRNRRSRTASLRQDASVLTAANATNTTNTATSNTGSSDAASSTLRQDENQDAAAATAAESKGLDRTTASPKGGQEILRRDDTIRPDWRLRVRMRTTGIGLVLCLNIGTDPPDLVKPHPCAVLQGWMDPTTVSRQKAKEWIGERLEQQYAAWQLARTARPLRYRRAADPTVDDVRSLCLQLRRQARNERVLLHYNGHGVPRPTPQGEIWVFDKNHTEYIPLAVADLRAWLGRPSMVVLDCPAAGVLLPYWASEASTASTASSISGTGQSTRPANLSGPVTEAQATAWVNDTIVLAPCAADQVIPMHPDFPADIFTSCLTTPIPMALRWFCRRQGPNFLGLDFKNLPIPGKANDRKTPLGELNWIFTAVTDSIAWNVLPRPLFQRLFRQDLLVASLFRNFLLADRILRTLNCTPVSHPPLPPGFAHHPLWQAWDLVCENLLFSLAQEGSLPSAMPPPTTEESDDHETTDRPNPPPQKQAMAATTTATNVNISNSFFAEQLTAFEVWLDFEPIHRQRLATGTLEPPEQLPVVLQVLLSQTHRIRALELFRRFFRLGPWAVNLALSLGIFPYVMKLLQSPEYKSLLVSIWASVLSFDPSCRVDLLKDGAFHHFVQHVLWGLTTPTVAAVEDAARERTLAAFCLAAAVQGYPAGQTEAIRLNLHGSGCALLSSWQDAPPGEAERHLPAHFRLWLVLCLANMVRGNPATQHEAYGTGVHTHLCGAYPDTAVEVRAAVCYALGCLLGAPNRSGSRQPSMAMRASSSPGDAAPTDASNRQSMSTHSSMPPALTVMPPAGMGGLPLKPTTCTFNPQGVGPPNWQGLNPLGQFLNPTSQPILPTQPAYGMAPLMATMPAGFLIGSSTSSPPQFFQSQRAEPRSTMPLLPSVFEDHPRLDMDLIVLGKLVQATQDASVVVRYEATVSLARAVGKYMDAFVVVASGLVSATSRLRSSPSSKRDFPIPRGLERKYLINFEDAWKILRQLQHEDPFPAISKTANEIVSVVHEHLLRFRMEVEKAEANPKEDSMSMHPRKLASTILAGIEEEIGGDTPYGTKNEQKNEQPSSLLPKKPEVHELRRVASEFAMAPSPVENSASQSVSTDDVPMHYKLPTSEFYEWKKKTFNLLADTEGDDEEMDPLSPAGAAIVYQERRNTVVRESGVRLGQHFEVLAPKAPKPSVKTIESLLEEDEEDGLGAASSDILEKKETLKMSEKKILRNNEGKMTSTLAFHPFEDVIMVCGANDNVSMWSTDTGAKLTAISNGNPSPSRVTYSTWINEESSSLFLVGCDDGSIRIWGDLLEASGGPSHSKPQLVSSFFAASMSPGQMGRSGLVCEWQPFNGSLLTGGNSDFITCWDMESEKHFLQLETKSEACITTMTTAWDYDALGMGPNPQGYRGIGGDIVLAGFSNGSMKVFDLRASRAVTELATVSSASSRSTRLRITGYSEHKNWIVSCAFTGYSSRYEFISGTTAGDIKAWDLRMSRSVRTFEAHRSGMTTLAVHSKVPLIATGSSSQIIKIFTPDGDMVQAFRYHEKMRSHRIGPVSGLAFHRYKPLLATGATDSLVGIYSSEK